MKTSKDLILGACELPSLSVGFDLAIPDEKYQFTALCFWDRSTWKVKQRKKLTDHFPWSFIRLFPFSSFHLVFVSRKFQRDPVTFPPLILILSWSTRIINMDNSLGPTVRKSRKIYSYVYRICLLLKIFSWYLLEGKSEKSVSIKLELRIDYTFN